MRFRFYDPKMHGVDWAAMKEKYQALLGNVGDSGELRVVIMQMIGELNAPHTGVTPGGEIGYLHIRAMDAPSLQTFQRDLMKNRSKKALIIDQRFNGGGGIDQELLQILNQRRQYQSTRGRDSLTVPRPVQTFCGPMVVLQNERSASDAEMFPDGFRTLGLGRLVGVPTYGAVIGAGSYRLLDGSTIRTPGSGVFTARGENMENYGVVPDVIVDNTPENFLAERHRQDEKAVEILRGQIKR
jgi:tricorn protease